MGEEEKRRKGRRAGRRRGTSHLDPVKKSHILIVRKLMQRKNIVQAHQKPQMGRSCQSQIQMTAISAVLFWNLLYVFSNKYVLVGKPYMKRKKIFSKREF